ncbi:hypothetical protein CKQ84_18955 [Shewanella sp. WE21]|jgi:hypothetical protein|uniref:hypothetical protein n=1 Tax=Shewanella sp. WE21 TaxID=2029986 RepID=UPI000CF619D7|nr:hypothetical protein [Shewanella sp. WE21]AVI67756.1 hypothetical protein CKQ84_18955 [Shewanella sp. WE21]
MITINTWALTEAINTDKSSSPTAEVIKADIHHMDRLIKSAVQLEDKLDRSMQLTTRDAATVQMLATIMAAQKQIVLGMLSQNPEAAIAQLLAGSIENLAKQLELLKGWTEGGQPMFDSALQAIYEGLLKDGVTGSELEDLFQLAMMDFISHTADYPALPSGMKDMIMHYLESTGSGSHGFHEGWSGEKFAANCASIFDFMLNNAPNGSLCSEILHKMSSELNAPNSLVNQYKNHFTESGGFINDSSYPDDAGASPMLRMALMAAYLAKYPTVSQETIEMFLTAPVGELNAFISSNTPGESYGSAMDFLYNSDGSGSSSGWNTVHQQGHEVIDWYGVGLDATYFENMYTNFPARALTDEDIKEVNRIGDQVKMLQETLKYWIQICRDEYLAAVRNI